MDDVNPCLYSVYPWYCDCYSSPHPQETRRKPR